MGITFSTNRYDSDGDIVKSGIILHFEKNWLHVDCKKFG